MTSLDQQIPRTRTNRVRGILFKPDAEWQRIKAEPFVTDAVYSYIAVLSSIPALSKMMGVLVFGYPGPMGTRFRPPFVSIISAALLEYFLTLISIFFLVLMADFIAPWFGGKRNRSAAIKLVAYASTASWVTGIFSFLPGLGVLRLAGLYSIYLLFRGAPVLMEIAREKLIPYVALLSAAGIVFCLVVKTLTL